MNKSLNISGWQLQRLVSRIHTSCGFRSFRFDEWNYCSDDYKIARWEAVLASIPKEIQSVIRQYEDIFTTRVLLNVFASRQAHFEKENWKYLRAEVARSPQKGKQHRPRKALNYPKGRAGGSLDQQRERQTETKEESKPTSAQKFQNDVMTQLSAQNSLREMLSTWVEVSNGEIRIKYCGEEDLERLKEIIEVTTNRNLFPALDRIKSPKSN